MRLTSSVLRTVLPASMFNRLQLLYWRLLILLRMAYLREARNLLIDKEIQMSVVGRFRLLLKCYWISTTVECPHRQNEVLQFVRQILILGRQPDGVFVEAGCFQGGSSAKFSLAAKAMGKKLVIFDSFEGIPANKERHEADIFGGKVNFGEGFREGDYCGTFKEVYSNISRFGSINPCELIQGWFEETMPRFKGEILGVYLDVDLASSTRTCLKYLYPQIRQGGVLMSQDGHLPLVLEVFDDDEFWHNEVGTSTPRVVGFGHEKLITIYK